MSLRRASVLWIVVACAVGASVSLTAAIASPAPTVVVPHLGGAVFQQAYDRLHKLGLRVSVPGGIELDSLERPTVYVMQMTPAPGQRVAAGSIVKLTLGCNCGAGSPGGPIHLPQYRVPSFIGRRVTAAVAWVRHKVLVFHANLGPLRAGRARHFFDNYRVTRQRPAPGTILKLGHGTVLSPTSGVLTPTPLTVWGTQPQAPAS